MLIRRGPFLFHGGEFGDEGAVIGHPGDLLHMRALEAVKEVLEPCLGELIGDRMIGLGNDVLADHHVDPSPSLEELVEAGNDPCRRPEQVDLVLERLGQLHLAKSVPEGFSDPFVRVIMKDYEVADALHFKRRATIVIGARRFGDVTGGKQIDQARDSGLDQWMLVDSSGS